MNLKTGYARRESKNGYARPADAARAFGWNENAYKSHENGVRGLRPEVAEKNARAFGFAAAHLIYGENGSSDDRAPAASHSGRGRTFIKEWREFRSLPQQQLADRIELKPSALSQLERRLVSYTQPTLEAIAAALMCEPADLLVGDPLQDETSWSVYKNLSPKERRQAIAIIKVLRQTD